MMQGYIYLETFPDEPQRVRILTQDKAPDDTPGSQHSAHLRYVAKFNNAHIAYMHVHNTLRRQLEHIDTRIYRVGLPQAIAAIESEDLNHERIWIDPALDESALVAVANHTQHLQQQQRRNNRLYLIVGAMGVLLLLFILLGGIWHA